VATNRQLAHCSQVRDGNPDILIFNSIEILHVVLMIAWSDLSSLHDEASTMHETVNASTNKTFLRN